MSDPAPSRVAAHDAPRSDAVRVAVDIGGTFTDVQVLVETTGETHSLKTPTTPEDPSIGLATGVRLACERLGLDASAITTLMHGTTIATNAVLERKLPRGAVVTTAGFEDVLEIGRHVRRDVYASVAEDRALLVPRSRRFGVTERIHADGSVETPLDPAEVNALAERLRALEVRTVAVCLLHAYANPAHEKALVEELERALPDVSVCASHAVSPELREFERTSTTVINALLMPVVGDYLGRLESRLASLGFGGKLYLFQSNGGVMLPERAAAEPVRLLLSGPAGGALATGTLGRRHAMDAAVGIDMGGTSFDVCVVDGGTVREVAEDEVAGLPVRIPMSEIRTISAGGGSIARVGPGGDLRVGPDSAGARPGPACYGHGGSDATVTDANVTLGRLDPARFLGGDMTIDVERAREAVRLNVAKPLGLEVETAAAGVLRVAVVQMAAAIRLSLFEKGLDPRDFTLVSFGGAGGLHAAEVAEELGATRVIVPTEAATLSAWGMLYADVVHDGAVTRAWQTDSTPSAALRATVDELVGRGRERLAAEGFTDAEASVTLMSDMRYPGQAYEIPVAWPRPTLDDAGLAEAVNAFHDAHEQQFAHAERDTAPEVLTWRTRATGRLPAVSAPASAQALSAEADERKAVVDGEAVRVAVLGRGALATDAWRAGPLFIEDGQTTTWVPPGWRASRLGDDTLVLEQAGHGEEDRS